MQCITRGEGDPHLAVVAGVHGDEPAGPHAIERLLAEDIEFTKPVKFVIANEKALEAGKRFLDTDLNRSFPGDTDSENHEERLAAALRRELSGCAVLDLHETRSTDTPFAILDTTDDVTDLVQATGVQYAADFSRIEGHSLIRDIGGVVVETGPQRTEQSREASYQVLRNFLAATGAITGGFERSNPELFRIREEVPKDTGTRFLAENFQEVSAGSVYAETADGEQLTADEPFIPVLMSTDGYTDILGFRADHAGRLSETE